MLHATVVLLFAMQGGSSPAELAVRMTGMTAVSGLEQRTADTVAALIPGSARDRAGNVVVTLGSGAPRRLIVCPMDEAGYVVGNVTPEGFLTLRRVGRPPSPLFDQWHEGHRVTVWTRGGALSGVVAIPSTHLTRGRTLDLDTPFHVDDAHVEVGATSPAEVTELGITPLDAVALTKQPHRYGSDLLAAPWAAQRAACGALASVLINPRSVRGTVIAVFAVESRIRHRGLLTAGNTRGPFTETLLLGYESPREMPADVFGDLETRVLSAQYPFTPVETVSLAEVEQFATALRTWMGGGQ